MAAVTKGETDVIEEVVADKGYHSNQTLVDLSALDLRTDIAEPDRGQRVWRDKSGRARRGVGEPATHSWSTRLGSVAAK